MGDFLLYAIKSMTPTAVPENEPMDITHSDNVAFMWFFQQTPFAFILMIMSLNTGNLHRIRQPWQVTSLVCAKTKSSIRS